MESADLEEQLRIYARDKEDSGSAYALEALKRRVPEDFQLVVDEADRRTGEIVGASPALIGDGPHESWYVPQPSIEQRWRHYKEQLANSSLGQAGLDRVDATSNQIVERLPNRVQRISQHVVWYSAMFRAERQQTFSPLQPAWITNTTSSSSWRAFTIRSGGRLRSEPNRPSCTIPSFGGVVQQPGVQIRRQLACKPLEPRQASPAGGQKAEACPEASRRLAVRLRRRPTTKTKILVIGDEADQAGLDVSEV